MQDTQDKKIQLMEHNQLILNMADPVLVQILSANLILQRHREEVQQQQLATLGLQDLNMVFYLQTDLEL